MNKSRATHKEESIVNSDTMMAAICNPPPPLPPPQPPSSEALSSPVIICLSPSPSPELSDSETQSECSICLAAYRSGEDVSILACSHEYHSACLKQWMTKHRSCPMCRLDIYHQPQFVTLLLWERANLLPLFIGNLFGSSVVNSCLRVIFWWRDVLSRTWEDWVLFRRITTWFQA